MALITADFSLSFDKTLDKFVITDTTDYVGQSEDPADWDGVLTIVDPSGTTIYNNTSFVSPDIDPDVSTVNSLITLPKDAALNVLNGVYTITYTISDGVSVCPVAKTFNFQYVSPTVSIDAEFDCVAPLIQSNDATNYLVAGQSPTSNVRSHTLFYPDTTPGPDISGDVALIQTSVMYVLDNGEPLQYEINLTSTLVYSYPAGGVNSAFGVNDQITGDDYLNITCDPNLCSIYCGLKSQYDLYISTKGTPQGDKAKEKLALLAGLAEIARVAFECNKPEDVTELLAEIQAIGNFNADCACGDGEVVLYQGLGIIAPGVVVAEGTGIDVVAVTVGSTTTYTVSVETALIDIINGFEKALPVAGDQMDVTDLGVVAGVRSFQIDLELGLTVGNIPMVDSSGDLLEDSPLSYDGTSMAVSLASGKDLAFVFGNGTLTLDDATALLAQGALSAGVFNDGGTDTAALVAAPTSHVKATATDIISTFAGHTVTLDAASGISFVSVGADTATMTIKDGEFFTQGVKHEIELVAGPGTFRMFSAVDDVLTVDSTGKFALGLGAAAQTASDVTIGENADTRTSLNDANIAIGKDSYSVNSVSAVEVSHIAIGEESRAVKGGQIAIGHRAGNDLGTNGLNAISIGNLSNYSVVSNGIGQDSIAIGQGVQNYGTAANAVSIGENIEISAVGAITLGYSTSATALTSPQADSFNLGFDVTTPQVTFGVTSSFYNLSNIIFGDTGAAPSVLSAKGDMEVTDIGNGFILKSPDSTRYRIEVANGGALSTSAV